MTSSGPGPTVSVIVLAYGEEPWLEDCIDAILHSERVAELEIILVDNGCTDGSVALVAGRPGVTVVRPEANLGFAGGCNYGAARAGGAAFVFVNSDAVVAPAAVQRLASAAIREGVGIATGSIRLADRPELLNSGGNQVHFLGLGWAGRFGEPASRYSVEEPAASASGAGMAMSRAVWEDIGGFEDTFFAYHEDAELSLRCWQRGLAVLYTPEAVVAHYYEFSRNPLKLYLLERNRLIFVLTLYERRTLLLLAPVLILFETAMLASALSGGWARQKLEGWVWLARHRRWVRERRRALQATRTVPDADLAHLLAGRIDSGHLPLPRWLKPMNAALSVYWRWVRVCLRSRRR